MLELVAEAAGVNKHPVHVAERDAGVVAAVRPVASDKAVANRAFSETGDCVDQASRIGRNADAIVIQDLDIVDLEVRGLTL